MKGFKHSSVTVVHFFLFLETNIPLKALLPSQLSGVQGGFLINCSFAFSQSSPNIVANYASSCQSFKDFISLIIFSKNRVPQDKGKSSVQLCKEQTESQAAATMVNHHEDHVTQSIFNCSGCAEHLFNLKFYDGAVHWFCFLLVSLLEMI